MLGSNPVDFPRKVLNLEVLEVRDSIRNDNYLSGFFPNGFPNLKYLCYERPHATQNDVYLNLKQFFIPTNLTSLRTNSHLFRRIPTGNLSIMHNLNLLLDNYDLKRFSASLNQEALLNLKVLKINVSIRNYTNRLKSSLVFDLAVKTMKSLPFLRVLSIRMLRRILQNEHSGLNEVSEKKFRKYRKK